VNAPERFDLSTVAHLVRPTGRAAHDLDTLLAVVRELSPAALFHHTVQYRLREPLGDEVPRDDLSNWVGGVAQDPGTAERLAFAIGEHSNSADDVRAAIAAVLEEVPERARKLHDVPEGGELVFLASESVVLPTGRSVVDLHDLHAALTEADHGVWFFHLVEEPWFHGRDAGLLGWVRQHDRGVADTLANEGANGQPLETVRKRVLQRWRRRGLSRRLVEANGRPDDVRRAEAREVMERLARRMKSEGGS
jgi:GNAT superfamily N-acetyltransferase